LAVKRPIKWYFKREKEIMERLGLTPTKASGSGWKEKEDGYNDHVLAQLKSTDASSYRITLDDINKLEYHAMVEHKAPVFLIDFIKPDKLYLVVEVNNIQEVYNHLFGNNLSMANKPQPTIINELLQKDQDETASQLNRRKIASGNKEKFWEDRQQEYENRRAKNE
jgi:hypothetical protein